MTENNGKDTESKPVEFASDQYTAEDRLRQKEEIEAEINKRPLVGFREEGLESLKEELKGTYPFTRKIPHLETNFLALRRIRGDGNCFYRGFLFRLLETIIFQRGKGDDSEYLRVKKKLDDALDYLTEVRYDKNAIDFFCDFVVEFMQNFPRSLSELEKFFQDPQESMFLVWFCRLLCGGYIKHHWDMRFQWFVEESKHYLDADDFCQREVEPSDMECEEIQIIALCEYLEVRIRVEYLGAELDSDTTVTHYFGPEDKEAEICLLYRPGHYDIIYAK
mmetsp:Transcript_7176/g.8240  ORF Transcript_7176/g.8240 Transcript_7176/m.8240 type:complete len:277 (+) Transcript_7176:175-1005(+)